MHERHHDRHGERVRVTDFERTGDHRARGEGERTDRRGAAVAVGDADFFARRAAALDGEYVLVEQHRTAHGGDVRARTVFSGVFRRGRGWKLRELSVLRVE